MTEDQGRDRRRLSISDDAPGPLHNQGTKVTIYPSWLDRRSYPFESRYIDVDGGRMHYVDQGEGEPLLRCTAPLHGPICIVI